MGDNTARKRERDTEKEKRLTNSEIEELIKSGILKTDEEKREKVIKDLKFLIKAFEKLPKEKEKYEKLLKEVKFN